MKTSVTMVKRKETNGGRDMPKWEYDHCSDKNGEYYTQIVTKSKSRKIRADKRNRLLSKLREWESELRRKGITQ